MDDFIALAATLGIWSWIATVVAWLAGTAILFWLLYISIRAGVRDGILRADQERRYSEAINRPDVPRTRHELDR